MNKQYCFEDDDSKKINYFLQIKKFKKGNNCIFVPFKKNVGAKLYYFKSERNSSFFNQKHAHDLGMGPKVGDKFEIFFNDEILYCYLTQIAGKISSAINIDEVKKQYEDLKMDVSDLHFDNLGIIRKKIVVVDFDSDHFTIY